MGGMRKFGEGLFPNTKLATLRVGGNPLGEQGVVETMSFLHRHRGTMFQSQLLNKGIRSLDISDVGMTGEGSGVRAVAASLQQDVGLGWLSMSKNAIGDEGLALVAHALASNTLLRSLIIGDTGISDDGVASFTAALRTTATGQASDATLGIPVSDLTFLDVSNNHIGDPSATVIGKLMARTHTLGMVSLASTSVSNVGAAHLLEAARSNSVVRYIDLEETDVSQELQVEVARACHAHRRGQSEDEAQHARRSGSKLKNLAITVVLGAGLFFVLRRNN